MTLLSALPGLAVFAVVVLTLDWIVIIRPVMQQRDEQIAIRTWQWGHCQAQISLLTERLRFSKSGQATSRDMLKAQLSTHRACLETAAQTCAWQREQILALTAERDALAARLARPKAIGGRRGQAANRAFVTDAKSHQYEGASQ